MFDGFRFRSTHPTATKETRNKLIPFKPFDRFDKLHHRGAIGPERNQQFILCLPKSTAPLEEDHPCGVEFASRELAESVEGLNQSLRDDLTGAAFISRLYVDFINRQKTAPMALVDQADTLGQSLERIDERQQPHQ